MALGGEDQNISFWCEKARALRWEKRREEEKNKKKSRFGASPLFGICMELLGTLVWNSCLKLMLGIHVLNSCWEYPFLYGITINLSLSKLCRKNPIRSVVGWYKMSFMVYFEF